MGHDDETEAGAAGRSAAIRAMFRSDAPFSADLSTFEPLMRPLLTSQADRATYLRKMFIMALGHGSAAELAARSVEDKARQREDDALREGVRGYFFLPRTTDRGDQSGLPRDGDVGLVGDDAAEARFQPIERRLRWAGLRWGRADGRRPGTPATCHKYGQERRGRFADRLIADLEAFLADEDAVRTFVDDVIVFGDQHPDVRGDRSLANAGRADQVGAGGAHSAPDWSAIAHQLVAVLDVHVPPYPPQMLPSVLARPLSVSPLQRGKQADGAQGDDPELKQSFGGMPVRRVLARERRVVVLGPPGSGKSTVLVGEVLRRLRKQKPAIIVHLPDVAAALADRGAPTSAENAVELIFEITCRELGVSTAGASFVRALAGDASAAIALDGLDEVEPSELPRVHALLRHLESVPGSVLVSSRILGYSSLPGDWHEVTVDVLSPRYSRTFMASWFEGRPARLRKRAERALGRSDATELTRRPALLGIVATVAGEEEVPRNRGALYDRYLAVLLQRTWRPPEHRRTDMDDLSARRRASAELAWYGATGGTSQADEGPWTDTVTLVAAQRDGALSSSAAAQDLVENDVVLSPHGRHTSRLHQRYIWSHRTVPEHLVGAYLETLYRERPGDWREQLERLALGPERWREPLVHMTQLLDGAGQLELLTEIRRIEGGNDPTWTIRETAFELMKTLPRKSAARRAAAEWAAEAGSWGSVRDLDTELWRIEWPNVVHRGDDTFILGVAKDAKKIGLQWLVDLIDRYDRAPRAEQGTYLALLSELGELDPDGALERYVTELDAGCDDDVEMTLHWKRPPSEEAVDHALTRAKQLAPAERLTLLRALRFVGIDLAARVVPNGPIDPVEFHMLGALVDERMFMPYATTPEALASYRILAQGHYGRGRAYDLGQDPGFNVIDVDDTMPYTQLGVAARALDLVDRNEAPEVDVTDALASLLTVEESAVSDPSTALALLEGAGKCLGAAKRIPLPLALDLYKRLLTLHNSEDTQIELYSAEYDIVKSLRDAALRIVFNAPFEDVLECVLASRPEEWPAVWEYDDPTVDLAALIDSEQISLEPPLVTASEMVDLIVWAAPAGLSAASALMGRDLQDDAERTSPRQCGNAHRKPCRFPATPSGSPMHFSVADFSTDGVIG